MSLTYRIDSELGFLRAFGSGVLSMADMLAYFTTTRADPRVDLGMHRLMDLREVTQLPSSDEVRALAAFARAKPPADTARMAVIATSDLAFGVSMMFKAFVGYGDRLIVVRDEDEALAWVTNAERRE